MSQMYRQLMIRTRRLVLPSARTLGVAVALLVLAVLSAALLVERTQVAEGDRDAGTTAIGQTSGAEPGFASDNVAPDEAKRAGTGGAAGAPPSAASAAAPGGGGAPLPSLEAGRAIVRTGAMDVTVRSVSGAYDAVRSIATASGGYVADSTFTGGDEESATLTLRVPADRFAEVVAQLRGAAVEVRSLSNASRDVTAEYTDIEATLRNLRAVEAQYSELLRRAGAIGEIVQVQDRLNQVRLQIDRTEARRQLLQSQTEMATLAVTLRPVAAATGGGSGPRAAAAEAWAASLETLESIGTAAIVVVVYSWWLLPPAAVAGYVLHRRRRASAATPPAAAA